MFVLSSLTSTPHFKLLIYYCSANLETFIYQSNMLSKSSHSVAAITWAMHVINSAHSVVITSARHLSSSQVCCPSYEYCQKVFRQIAEPLATSLHNLLSIVNRMLSHAETVSMTVEYSVFQAWQPSILKEELLKTRISAFFWGNFECSFNQSDFISLCHVVCWYIYLGFTIITIEHNVPSIFLSTLLPFNVLRSLALNNVTPILWPWQFFVIVEKLRLLERFTALSVLQINQYLLLS